MRVEFEENGEKFVWNVEPYPGFEEKLETDPPIDRASIDAGEHYGWWLVTKGLV